MSNVARKSTGDRARSERMEVRVTAGQKDLIVRAAALEGQSLTAFVLTSVQAAARRAIEEHNRLSLTVRDSEVFAEGLLNRKPVNDRLHETIRDYRERTGI